MSSRALRLRSGQATTRDDMFCDKYVWFVSAHHDIFVALLFQSVLSTIPTIFKITTIVIPHSKGSHAGMPMIVGFA